MPETSSMIRTVPGGKAGPEGGAEELGCPAPRADGPAGLPPDRATTTPSATSTTTARTPIQTRRPFRLGGGDSKVSVGDSADGGSGGASTGECWTATPGPAGVVRS